MDPLFDFGEERDVQVNVLEYGRTLVCQGTLLRTHPPVHLLFYHLEEALCVNGVYVNFGLKASVLIGPWKWLTHHAIGPEFSQTLVHGVENGFVQDMLTFLRDGVREG